MLDIRQVREHVLDDGFRVLASLHSKGDGNGLYSKSANLLR